MSFQHCVLSSLSSSDILYYFLHACVLSRSAQQMCRPHPQNLPITGFSRMFYNEIMHSYPVYLLKRILATYFRYRRASFFFFHSRLLLTIPQTAAFPQSVMHQILPHRSFTVPASSFSSPAPPASAAPLPVPETIKVRRSHRTRSPSHPPRGSPEFCIKSPRYASKYINSSAA